jgi:hypothetical protein
MVLPNVRQQTLEQAFQKFNLLRDPAHQSWVFLNPTSLGDTMMVCTLMKAFKEKHGGPITMVVAEEQAPLAQMYPGHIDRVVATPFAALQGLCIDIAEGQIFCKDQPFVAHPYWHGEGRWEGFFELFRYPKRGGVGFADLYRHMLRLGWDAPLARPTVPQEWRKEAENIAAQLGVIPGKSVILFPDNNSNPTFSASFWEPLAEELSKSGLKVFTNLAGNRNGRRKEPFKGTSAIVTPLHLAIPLVEIAGRYISGANGLIAILMMAEVRSEGTLLIYNKPYSLNDYTAKDPVAIQSARYLGFSDLLPNEYLVDPDQVTASLLADIAANNPKTAFVW